MGLTAFRPFRQDDREVESTPSKELSINFIQKGGMTMTRNQSVSQSTPDPDTIYCSVEVSRSA
ncbi:MAG: hypothetical protein OXH47_07370 [Paracoccaceae bacterium]|nr:hypothetical protein [Paracoccaceae bacterium]